MLIGGLRHIEDGDIPQTVEVSVASLNSVVGAPPSEQRSTLESWVLGDWGESGGDSHVAAGGAASQGG